MMEARAPRSRRSDERGLTLVELGAALAVLAAIGGALGVGLSQAWRTARLEQAAHGASVLWRAAAAAQAREPGRCPSPPQLGAEGRLEVDASVLDPWGQPYRIDCESGVTVRSAGPDRRLGTADDLTASDETSPLPRRAASSLALP